MINMFSYGFSKQPRFESGMMFIDFLEERENKCALPDTQENLWLKRKPTF